MPKVEDIFSKLIGAKYFSMLDLWAGYHYIPLNESSIPKNSIQLTFQQIQICQSSFWTSTSSSIFPRTYDRYLKTFHLHHYLLRLHHHLQQNSRRTSYSYPTSFWEIKDSTSLNETQEMSIFFTREKQYLGHILSTNGIWPLPSKTWAIKTMHPPKIPKQACTFLGLVGYYRKFIKNFAKIAKPLTLLTCQQATLDWTPPHPNDFLMLKESVIQAPILQYPDPNRRYIMYTGASDDACGAQLSQEHNGTEFPIAFLSCTFLDTQRKWSTTDMDIRSP